MDLFYAKKLGLVSALSTDTIFQLVTYADATREATIAVFMVIVFEIVVIVLPWRMRT
jgi:hypothetical protein